MSGDTVNGPGKHRATTTSVPPHPMPTRADDGQGWWVLLAWSHDGVICTSVVPVIAWAAGGPAIDDFDSTDDHRGRILLTHHVLCSCEDLGAAERLLRTAAKRRQHDRAHALDILQSRSLSA